MLWLWLACKLPPLDTAENRIEYSINCDTVECIGADSITDSPYYHNRYICTWNCVNYKDANNAKVVIDFTRTSTDECFHIYTITVSDGYCEDWNF